MVTGGTGFVGANLVRRLLADGHEVHLMVRRDRRAWRLADVVQHVRCHELDFLDSGAVARVTREVRPEWMFHLAAHGAYSWQREPAPIVATNLTALVHLIDACAKTGFESFVNIGSSSEYGYKDHPAAESERVDPNSLYAVTKAAATHYCRLVAARDKLTIPTLRLHSVYGPYEEPNRLMPRLIAEGRRGQRPPLASPETARDYVYVDDVVDACLRAATTKSEEQGAIYNIGSGVQTRLREVVAISDRVLGLHAPASWGQLGNRAWDTDIWVADIAKSELELGWRARISVEEGFSRMVSWFREKYDDAALAAYCAESNAP